MAGILQMTGQAHALAPEIAVTELGIAEFVLGFFPCFCLLVVFPGLSL